MTPTHIDLTDGEHNSVDEMRYIDKDIPIRSKTVEAREGGPKTPL